MWRAGNSEGDIHPLPLIAWALQQPETTSARLLRNLQNELESNPLCISSFFNPFLSVWSAVPFCFA